MSTEALCAYFGVYGAQILFTYNGIKLFTCRVNGRQKEEIVERKHDWKEIIFVRAYFHFRICNLNLLLKPKTCFR
jgi:hypothetical protein